MGRHTRDEEPVPHPLDRTPSVPAEGRPAAPGRPHPGETTALPLVAGRGEASGAFRKPRRSSISDAFGIAGRASRASGRSESSGSYFVPANETPAPAATARRGETSGAYPAASRGPSSGAQPTRRGEASGAYPAAVRVEPAVARPTRRGEASGPYPATRRDESAAERTEVIARLETADDHPVAARGETSGSFRAVADVRTAERTADRTPDRTEVTGEHEVTGKRRARRDSTTEGEGRRRAPGRGDTTGPHRTSDKGETTGSHRVVGKSDATGSHRIVGKKAPRRRIAGWPIACLVLAVLIGLGVIGWNWADNELNSRAEAQAASCSGGTSQMRVVVTPSVQKPLAAAAERWNQAATVVHGQCVHVTIDAKASSQVLDALVGRAGLDSIGGLPAAWLPESSYWVSELTTKKPEMIGSPAQSVANARSADYPFIGLTGQGIDDTVLRAAQTFREYLEQPAQQADFAAAGIKTA
ncbi:hypothetical protein DMA12_46075 [Amycolatopsis balhimycina DSM 5908]|uniref:Uncharacterized protein n=1 Tax=Amycolatopsis balhimycina DSM 5908 TaxID=1081091 RepID=A0A428VVV3_AMYBA|nr:hypothetical protein [Amycolatopsis balhimycina]RSM34980.1 hypothetical protein DMA12_46075 [Amycolatopsis balhimycina DSM 5908]